VRVTRPLRRGILIACLGLTACVAGLRSREGRWTGEVTPIGGTCPPSHATLTVGAGAFSFTPDDGVLVVRGKVAPDGTLQGTLPLVGQNHVAFPLNIAGTLTPDGFTGTYTTPKCRATVRMRRA